MKHKDYDGFRRAYDIPQMAEARQFHFRGDNRKKPFPMPRECTLGTTMPGGVRDFPGSRRVRFLLNDHNHVQWPRGVLFVERRSFSR